jgi:hypothetical protein
MPDWTEGRYVRVFAALADDYPAVWAADALLAWYVRLLGPADGAWPHGAYWPRGIPAEIEATLVALGALDRVGEDRYLVHGMDRLRAAQTSRGLAGGKVRASTAPRDSRGRMLGRDAGPDAGRSNGAAGTATLAADAGGTLETGPEDPDAGPTLDNAGPRRWAASVPANRPDETRQEGSTETPPVDRSEFTPRARAREAPVTIACDDYTAHRSDHVNVAGVGWKCLTCEKAWAERDALVPGRTFADRVGWSPPAVEPVQEPEEEEAGPDDAHPF